MPLEVFSINEPYIDKDCIICGSDSEQYAVRISDSLQSSKYKRIEMIDADTFFLQKQSMVKNLLELPVCLKIHQTFGLLILLVKILAF